MTKNAVSFEDASKAVISHVQARGWDKTNDDRRLAISISLEANELLEYFQWHGKTFGNKDDLASELADVFIYAIQFADRYNIDISQAIMQKLDKSAKKYPVEIFQITDKTERNKVWLEAKQNYKKDTTL